MNSLQIANIALSMICMIITTVLAWATIYRTNKTEITFSGTPVDKKDFEKHLRENKEDHDLLFARLENIHARINPIEAGMSALRQVCDLNTARLAQIDGKIDRLIERTKTA